MEDMISLDFIDLGSIDLFSLNHRKRDKKENDRSCNTKIFGFESEKCEYILSEKKCCHHPDEYHDPDTCPISSEFSHTCTWMQLRIE